MASFRHSLYMPILAISALCMLLGGAWMWFSFLVIAGGAIVLDSLLAPDHAAHDDANPKILNAFLFLMLPGLYLNIICFNWQLSAGDWLGLGAFVRSVTGYDIVSAKAGRTAWDTVGAYASLGLLIASGGTTVAHELVHRVWSSRWVTIGRWLLAPTLDTSFSVEHVYGHHAHVATGKDPASARRGENLLGFFFRSTFGSVASAWNIEKTRLRKKANKGPISFSNRVISGQLMSLAVLGLFIWAQGTWGIASFFIVAIYGKFYLEAINYVEHYGLARVPGRPVEVKHSWNGHNRYSMYILFNLPRHSHHHAKGHLPFWKLKAEADAPVLPYGYMTMILLAMVPPIFKRVMAPTLNDWDNRIANPDEVKLAKSYRLA